MVKVEVDLPENLYRALTLLNTTFKISIDRLMAQAVEGEILGACGSNLSPYAEVLARRLERIVEGSKDP